MNAKHYTGTLELKGETEGAFRATFATLGVIDRDGDVTTPGAFQDGQAVKIAAWGHNWNGLTVGKGTIHANDKKAWVDGLFNLKTQAGREHYETVKFNGADQQWSYGFEITKHSFGDHEGRDVRFLEKMDVFEVSPVLLAAGVGTRTDSIKSFSVVVADKDPECASRHTPDEAEAKGDPLTTDQGDAVSISVSGDLLKTEALDPRAKVAALFEQLLAAIEETPGLAEAKATPEPQALLVTAVAPTLPVATAKAASDLDSYLTLIVGADQDTLQAAEPTLVALKHKLAEAQAEIDRQLHRAATGGPTAAALKRRFDEVSKMVAGIA